MNSKWTAVMGFLAGGALGLWAGQQLTKARYQAMVQAEIESVKDSFRRLRGEGKPSERGREKPEPKKEEKVLTTESQDEQKDRMDYRRYYRPLECQEETMEDRKRPYRITMEEYLERGDYCTMSMTLRADGTVADETGALLDHDAVESKLGWGNLVCDEKTEVVYIRDDELSMDYEVCMEK